MKKLTLAFVAALLATACAVGTGPASTPAPGAAPAATAASGRKVTVRGDVKVVDAAFKLKAAGDQPRVPYELRRVDHIQVHVREGNGGWVLVGTLDHQGTGDADHTFEPIVLSGLKPYTAYTAKLMAWQHDPAAGGLVQVDDDTNGASETAFNTFLQSPFFTDGANENITLPNGFALKLRDQGFSGWASGGLAVDDGHLNGPSSGVVMGWPVEPLVDLHLQFVFPDADPDFLGVDTDFVFEDPAGGRHPYHTSNPCGGGFCQDDPTSGTWTLSWPQKNAASLTYKVMSADQTQNWGQVDLAWDAHARRWRLASWVGEPWLLIRETPGLN